MPIMNPERGKRLFVEKGCVACHAINGIGGHDGPNPDVHSMEPLKNPFDFAAKMWNHAPAMISAQEEALGEPIYFTGDEISDIIAFIHDDGTQHAFTEKHLTQRARRMMHHDHDGHTGPEAHRQDPGHHRHPPGTKPHHN